VSIRDAVSILDALGEAAAVTRNPVLLTEFVRQAIRRTVVKSHLKSAGDLPVFITDNAMEELIESAVEHGEHSSHLTAPPQVVRDVLKRLEAKLGASAAPVAVLTSSGARYFLRQIAETALPSVAFLAHSEVPPGVKVVSLGVVQ